MNSTFRLSIALLALAAGLPCHAGVHAFSDFTRPANAASLTETFDFVPNEGWSGTPPNAITGEASVYLKMTVSWAAAASIGTFSARFNQGDDAGQVRWSIGTDGTGFGFLTGNGTSDPDAAGPATAKPTVAAYDKTANTSVTLVLKVNQLKTTPGGDYWFGNTITPGFQDGAGGFMWINPNLAAPEAGQPTPWAAWRSGNTSYQGVSFITDTAGVALNFSNIAIYTGDDTPFAASSGVVNRPAAVVLDAGGGRATSARFTHDGSLGGIVGVSTAGTAVAKHSYIGQLTEVTALQLAASPTTVNETATRQLSATQVLDDNSLNLLAGTDVSWSVQSGPITSINSSGLATAATVYQNTAATAQGIYAGNTATLGLTVLDSIADNFGSYAADGLGDDWQFQYFGLDNANAAPLLDPDGDGQNNRFEFTAGLIPTNPLSRFLVTIAAVPGQATQKQVVFEPVVAGRTYTVKTSPDLSAASWITLAGSNSSDIGSQRTITDTSATAGKKFYKVEIVKP